MICPACGHDNLPGTEDCAECGLSLTKLDEPAASNRVERSLMENEVRVLKPHAPVMVPPATTVGEAIRLMLDRNIGALLVVDAQGGLLGIFSERDLLCKVAGVHADYAGRRVTEYMTPKPETVTVSNTLAFALHKMDVGGYRHMPVMDEGKPVGMISVRDMLRHITHLCKER